MRRLFMLVGTVLGVAIGGFIATTMLIDTTAQEDRTIPVRVVRFSEGTPEEQGDRCAFLSRQYPDIPRTPMQLSVVDETGEMVALFTVPASTWEYDSELQQLECVIEGAIDVPDRSFYTLYLNDERVQSFAGAEFPLGTDGTIEIYPDNRL